MYDDRMVDRAEARLLATSAFRSLYPQGIPQYSIADTAAYTADLRAAVDAKGQPTRRLTPDEQTFIAATQLRITFHYRYFAERFVTIDSEGYGVRPLFPLWESQAFVLQKLGQIEWDREQAGHPDGLLLNILKARQLGISTLAESLIAHRVVTHGRVRALVGADVEDQAGYLFRMVDRLYQSLPWFLKTARVNFVKNREMVFSNQSYLKTAWGKSTRGALQSVTGQEGTKGAIGRGQTYSTIHISELATWDNPEQLDGALLPTVPIAASTLVIFESTAEIAGDWWHQQWLTTAEGAGRFTNVFIPWYAESQKYSLPAPIDWTPASQTLQHATKCERDAPKWMGRSITLSRDQLYWYERTRTYYQKKGELGKFLREYCLDGSMRVGTQRGRIPLRDVVAGDVTASGRVVRATTVSVQRVYEVRTAQGRVLRGTVDHRVILADGTEREIGDLQPADALTLVAPAFATTTPVCQWHPLPCVEARLTLTPELARFLGYYMGDGSYYGDRVDIACDSRDADVVAEVTGLLRALTGGQPSTRQMTTNGCAVSVQARELRRLFLALGIVRQRRSASRPWMRQVCIPEIIWQAPRNLVAAFLSALFESDGHSHAQCTRVSYFAKSLDFTRDIQYLLLGFGIVSSIRPVTRTTTRGAYPGHVLSLPAEAARLFYDQIGFRSARKQARRFRPKFVRRALIANRLVDQVQCVTALDDRLVYDLTIEGSHVFDANGLLVHNCADDQECFQYAGRAIFTFEQLEAIDQAGSQRPLKDVWAVEPAREIAELRRLPETTDLTPTRSIPPLAPRLPLSMLTTAAEAYPVPPGYGFRRLGRAELEALPSLRHSVLAIWEYPRSRGKRRYVMSVDVGDGLGQDYSVVGVIRQPTIDEPAEEVAQYVSNRVDAKALAFVCDAIGRFYADEDGIEALAAIETNNHGLSTQDTLQLHLGYSHFYVWEYADSASPDRRFSTKIGWVTTPRTRPMLLAAFHNAITTIDPITSQPDFILNSPITRGELRHFVTQGTIGEAEAARGQHDDAILEAAIGYYVAWRLAGGETEPISERRSRRAALQQQQAQAGAAPARDWRNSDATADEADHAQEDDDEFADDLGGDSGLHFGGPLSAARDRIF